VDTNCDAAGYPSKMSWHKSELQTRSKKKSNGEFFDLDTAQLFQALSGDACELGKGVLDAPHDVLGAAPVVGYGRRSGHGDIAILSLPACEPGVVPLHSAARISPAGCWSECVARIEAKLERSWCEPTCWQAAEISTSWPLRRP